MSLKRAPMKRWAAGLSAFAVALTGWAPGASAGSEWTTYHGDNSRSGVDSTEPSLTPSALAWTNALDGAKVYGQPVVADGRVFVATEGDDVYALDAHDGHVLWQANLGVPLHNVSSQVGCGNIDPLGITSTPVIDTARNTLYVVAEVSSGGALPVHHQLVGLDIYSGQENLSVDADPATGDDLRYLQQRAALAVANGRVYIGFGGLDGDCGTYHGWVVGINEDGGGMVQFDATPGSSDGAVWEGGGGPSVDSAGNVYVVTGNGGGPWANAVVKLDPNLDTPPLAAFQDSAATGDADLGTGDALLLPGGNLFTVGKTDIGFFLSQSNLSQLHAISGSICGSDPDGGATYDAATNSIYVPCRGKGIQQVDMTSLATGWLAGSADGAPILVDGELWAADYGSNTIQEIDPVHGTVMGTITLPAGLSLPTFATPSAADGLLLVGTTRGVVAFDGPSGPPPPAPPPPPPASGYRLIAADGGVFSFGTASYQGSLGSIHLTAPIVGGAATPDGGGYWLVASDGGVFAFGDASFYGSTGAMRLSQPVVGMAVAPGGSGYWLVARDGGVFAFGPGARFQGSTGAMHLNQPVVAMAADPTTGGYRLFAADGGVFSFDAPFEGSTGAIHLAQPIVAAAATPTGNGYWLVAADGGVFAFDAPFQGSTGAVRLTQPIVGMAVDAATGGYWLVAADGGVFSFDAPFEGSTGGLRLVQPVVGMVGAGG